MGFFFFLSGQTFTQSLKITGEKQAGNLEVIITQYHVLLAYSLIGESIAQKSAAPWCLVLNPALCVYCKPLGLVLKKYHQVGRWLASLGPVRRASLCSMNKGCL